MSDDRKALREQQIFEAAYRVLNERGYAGASMLSIAKETNASNETLYRWYGDKRGLFSRMVEDNAATIRNHLERTIQGETDPLQSLTAAAPILLSMLLGERAVALNRAAAADETGELGAAIALGGRSTVAPLIEALMHRAMEEGSLDAPSARQASEWFLSLLIGDLQVRRVNRTLEEPDAPEIEARATSAMSAFGKLCAA